MPSTRMLSSKPSIAIDCRYAQRRAIHSCSPCQIPQLRGPQTLLHNDCRSADKALQGMQLYFNALECYLRDARR